MSEIEIQLKNALITAIKDKELQKLEFKKNLLKTIVKAAEQDIENNFKHLENLNSEELILAFSKTTIPVLQPKAITIFSFAIDNLCSKDSQLFCNILGKANNEFFMEANYKNLGNTNMQFVPTIQPFTHGPQFGQQFPQSPAFGFQPFNFQNPEAPFPGFQSNRSTGQQNAGWSFNSVLKKFLIEKLESIYEKLSEQEIDEELLSEFEKVMKFCQNLNS